jgi:ubiquinone/menaquinone biosynthesis C-methylase UbiE
MTDLEQVTRAQQRMWATGDFHRIGVTQVVVGEMLARAVDIHAGERVLDVAAGAGNASLAAARRFADVLCTDYVPDLLGHAEARAQTEGLPIRTQVADAQALPFPDGSFDVVVSTFGAMFAPDQETTARELLRVLRPGGRLGMANWTPDSWIGGQFRLQAQYVPPAEGVRPPVRWGSVDELRQLLGNEVAQLDVTEQYSDFLHHSASDLFELNKTWFGPIVTAMNTLDEAGQEAFARDWIALADSYNRATDGTCVISAPYLQVVAVKRG